MTFCQFPAFFFSSQNQKRCREMKKKKTVVSDWKNELPEQKKEWKISLCGLKKDVLNWKKKRMSLSKQMAILYPRWTNFKPHVKFNVKTYRKWKSRTSYLKHKMTKFSVMTQSVTEHCLQRETRTKTEQDCIGLLSLILFCVDTVLCCFV